MNNTLEEDHSSNDEDISNQERNEDEIDLPAALDGGGDTASAESEESGPDEQQDIVGNDETGSRGTASQEVRTVGGLEDATRKKEPQPNVLALVEGPVTPEGSILSTPDDLPSAKGSLLSSPGNSLPASQLSISRLGYPKSRQPFDRRFSAGITPSPQQTPRAGSPAFLSSHSRKPSLSSQLLPDQDEGSSRPPWEVVRWTKLKKITGQVFSEIGRRNFGRPSCLVISASIAIGTSKGLILIFDYQQSLKSIIGVGTIAIECGGITSLAISADHSTIAGGHSTGHIFTWELSRPAKPFLHIPPMDRTLLADRKSDGHISGSAILHVGFLSTRHTALVSADDGGMAFSHLATRGLGAVGRAVRTTRILGRYPVPQGSTERPRKPSSVLAFAPLPLGNVEQATDNMGLTALLTPYLLVIVSTTPLAETQHKASRPREITPHSALSGCLAWFPAVKLKTPAGIQVQAVSKSKLVYCWSNVLTVLDVEVAEDPDAVDETASRALRFRPHSRWRASEAIVAVQWLTRSVLGVLTISQRLVILEDQSLRVTDSFDLLQKHVFHQDLFSKQLQPVVEDLEADDVNLHGVVADAFYMSFRAYKGRIFLLGFNDVSIGTLSNWADRLMALVEEGDFNGAISLATSYFNGDADKLTVGLPEDDEARHDIVREKLIEMISASLRYTFGRMRKGRSTEINPEHLNNLVAATFTACISMDELDFLFEDVYDAFEDASVQASFLDALEPYILDGTITAVPPTVLKDLISHYTFESRASRLEEMVCRLDPITMDIHQVTTLCKKYFLLDAFIHVWTQALGDYVTPIIELISLIDVLEKSEVTEDAVVQRTLLSANKIFPYMAFSLTGRRYPRGDLMPDQDAAKAKMEIYGFVFSAKAVEWPKGSGNVFYGGKGGKQDLDFPYLRAILKFDASNFMSMMNEVFEDSFLNGDARQPLNGATSNGNINNQSSGFFPTRQFILSILLEVMFSGGFSSDGTIFLDMFVARNLPKFPQFILLSGTALRKVLVDLCKYPSEDLAEDCQLSVEYLLSMHRPSDLQSLVPLLYEARFYRVLKSIYRSEKQYADLLKVYFEDQDEQAAVFDCIADCLRPSAGLNKKQLREVHSVILDNSRGLADIDAKRTATVLQEYAPSLVNSVFDRLGEDSQTQFMFLQAILEPVPKTAAESQQLLNPSQPTLLARYVRLMCRFEPNRVADYIGVLRSGDLRLDEVLPAMESSGVIDAAVLLMAREGLVQKAMDRLVKHMVTLKVALTSLVDASGESPDAAGTEEAAQDLLEAVEKYCKLGVWLCQGQSRVYAARSSNSPKKTNPYSIDGEDGLTPIELLWLDLVDAVVGITRSVSAASKSLSSDLAGTTVLDASRVTEKLRAMVQQSFTALLASTAADPKFSGSTDGQARPSFLLILRAFLTRASRSSPSLSDLRAVVADIFSAYTFEETILSLANEFLDKDLFIQVEEVKKRRERGWRSKGQVCERCGRKAWGLGAGGDIWDAWDKKRQADDAKRARTKIERAGGDAARALLRGKGRASSESKVGLKSAPKPIARGEGDSGQEQKSDTREGLGPLVVFACRHMFHQKCLEQALGLEDGTNGRLERRTVLKCPLE